MARRGVSPETNTTGVRKRKSASTRLKPVLAETGDAPAAAAGEPLTLDPRPYAPRPRKTAAKVTVERPGMQHPGMQRRARIAAAVAVTVAVGGAVAVGVVQAMHASGHHPPISQTPFSVAQKSPTGAVPAEATPIAVEAKPLTEYQPPDRDQVSSAFLKVGVTYRSEGLSGVVRQSMDCFSSLKQTPSYPTLDFCIAADAFGEALQRKLTDGQPPASDSYFAAASSRELSAARAVVGADGDAGARVLDIHRLAGEVSQAGSGVAATRMAENDRTPPAVVAAPREEPAASTPPVEAPPPAVKSLAKPAHASVHAPVTPVLGVAPPVRAAIRKAPALHAATPPRHATPRIETASTPMRESHPNLVKTRARVEPPAEHPRVTRVSAPVKPTHAHARLAEDDTRDAPRKPPRQHLAAATATHAPHHVAARDEDQASASPPWDGAIRAIRASLTARNDLANRRASEPSEWVDCHRPRTPMEVRLCEAPSGAGGGTLQDQYRSGRNR